MNKILWVLKGLTSCGFVFAMVAMVAQSSVEGAVCGTKSGPNAGWDTTHEGQNCVIGEEPDRQEWTCPKIIARVPAFTECQVDPTNNRCCESEEIKAKLIEVACGPEFNECTETGENIPGQAWPYKYLKFTAFHNCQQDPDDPEKWLPVPECSN